MKDYLPQKINFSNINLQKIFFFFETIRSTQFLTTNFITKKFQDNFTGFNDILAFFVKSGVVKVDDNKINVIRKIPFGNNDVKEFLLKNIFRSSFYVGSEVENFIDHFILNNGEYWFSGSNRTRLETSGIRNFLIEIGFISYSLKNNNYFILNEKIGYLSLLSKEKSLTPYQLSRKIKSIEELGIIAEQAILKYETLRLKDFPKLSSQVKHISQIKVNAGYDIQSYTVNSKTKAFALRFIEVKAVSKIDNKFYWSRNELAAAKNLKDEYYLYLLPMEAGKSYDIKNLIIIPNPFEKVFENRNEWSCDVELMSFTHIKNNS